MWNEIPHLNSFRARDQDRGLLGISRSKFASVNHLVQSPCQRRRWQADQKDQPLVRSTDTAGRLQSPLREFSVLTCETNQIAAFKK